MEKKEYNPRTCINHPDKAVHCRGLCKNCYDKLLKSENPDFKKKQYENHKKWEENNKDKVKEYQKKRRELHLERDKEVHFRSTIKRKYNLDVFDYFELRDKSNNTCYICGKPPYAGRLLHIDHNHETGEVRGLLCARCNWYLSVIEKNPEILNKIKQYLGL